MSSSMFTKAVCMLINTGLLFSAFPQEDTSTTSKEKPDSLATLDKMIITATRTNRLMSQTPASVSVISQDKIEISPAKNIDDLIMSETGVQVKRVVGMGEGIPSDVIIRGISGSFGSSRTLILVDGIPTNASGTPFLILNEIPLGAVKSIEVVRGPYSSLYGANAFGGAVNVLTQKGYGKPSFKGYFETSYPFTVLHKYAINEKSMKTSLSESGSETYYNVEGRSSGGNDRADYLVSAGFRNIGSYLLRDYAISKHDSTIVHKKNENYDYRDIRFFGKCGVTVNDVVDLELHARYFDSDLGFGKTKQLIPDSVDIVTQGHKFVIGPMARFSFSDRVTITVRSHYRTLIGEFWNEELYVDPVDSSVKYLPGYWKSQSHDWQVESQGIFKAGDAQTVAGGLEVLGNFIDFGEKINPQTDSMIPGTYAIDEGITNFAVYLQDEIALFKKLNIVPGLRMDYHSDFGSALSPKFGISYKLINWLRIKSSLGRAFRAPTLSELYMPALAIRSDFILKPNPDLTPEYIWAVDGGVEITPLPLLKFQIGGFYNTMKDLIGQTVIVTDMSVTHANISDAWTRGLEMEFEWQIKKWVNLFGNYIYQNTKNESASDVRKLFQRDKNLSESQLHVSLDYVPNQTANLGITLKKDIREFVFEGSFTEYFVGKRDYQEWTEVVEAVDIKIIPGNNKINIYIDPPIIPLDSYWRTDFGVKCTYKKRVWFALNIQNLFDAEYEEQGGTFAPGRFASIKIGGEF